MDKKNICLRLEGFDYTLMYRYAGLNKCTVQELVRKWIHERLEQEIDNEIANKYSNEDLIDIDSNVSYDPKTGRFVF